MLKFLADLTNVYRRQAVTIDNHSLFLNRVVTLGILIFCFLVQAGTTFFKTPIDCYGDKELRQFANIYCYVHSTYSIKNADAHIQKHINVGYSNGSEIKHDYYQWVTLTLIAQAALTYLPTFLWKVWEGGRIKSLTLGLQSACIPLEELPQRKAQIKQFLIKGLGLQRLYLFRFAFCDCLNVCVVFIQLYFINLMVGDLFTIGFDFFQVLGSNPLQRSDRMAFIFPTMSKCLVPKVGPSGREESRDFLCVLPFNLINEKMYTVLWVWFSLLAIFTSVSLLLSVMALFCKPLRTTMLQMYCHPGHSKSISELVSKLDVADWFVLCQIGKNVNSSLFSELIEELANSLKSTSHNQCKSYSMRNFNCKQSPMDGDATYV
ncbi:Hypothetical predicted protein [Cloeon dipterum]|uniref:Innexin n=1 Tax=Cloeon dipterum TaxID=197152 RepID=A0A8S1CBN8_9INSE|nr:Hypothetical predicted protein [Cloeon dipterum]